MLEEGVRRTRAPVANINPAGGVRGLRSIDMIELFPLDHCYGGVLRHPDHSALHLGL
jgi:hypothetical protein